MKLATATVLAVLATMPAVTATRAEVNQALTCRFEYEQSIERSDLSSPRPVSRPMAEPTTYTLTFNRETRIGTYTRDFGHPIGTAVSKVILLEGGERLTFYEGVSGDNMFILTVFTKKNFPDGRYPAVMSNHVWWPGTFLPSQMIGGCR